MKRLIFILFLFGSLLQAQTTWYISPSGNNANPGTLAQPKRNFYNMVTSPSVAAGDLIYALNGSYTESSQISVPVSVSIRGESQGGVVIESSYAGSGQPLFLLQTTNGWLGTYGNQTISYLTIDGNNTTYSAINVNYRSNVVISYITVRDFTRDGVVFYGMPMASWGGTSIFEPDRSMPDHWCTGNKLLYSTITNNSGPSDGANVRMGQQDGMEIAYCTITQPIRGSGTNCGGIKFYDEGWCKNTKIHDNTVTVALNPINRFNFSLEMWYELGGCEYYNNIFQGGTDFDCGGKGSSTYCVWFHDNEVGYPTYQLYNHYALNFEASFSDVIVERNYIHHTKEAFYFSQIWPNTSDPTQTGRNRHPYNTELRRIRINSNLFVNIGRANGGSDWEPVFGVFLGRDNDTEGQNVFEDISIINNTITCGSVTPDSYYVTGIWLPNSDLTVDNFIIRNNIITGFIGGSTYSAPIFGTGLYGTDMEINSYYVDNNTFYGNGNSNAILRVSGYPAPTTALNNLTSNPLYVGGTPYDYHLQVTSPSVATGVYIGSPVLYDYDGNAWQNPPNRGAYERASYATTPTVTTTVISDVTATTATGGGNVSSDGGASVTARGVCWSTSIDPTTADSKTTDGTGTGSYLSLITGLSDGLTYYVRAYATNTAGTSYGNNRSFVAEEEGKGDYAIVIKHLGKFIKIGTSNIVKH